MAEILVEYRTLLSASNGVVYRVRSCGRERADGLWEGWIEFVPQAGGVPLRTGRETTQPNRKDLLYWATGITDPYLDGALGRVERNATAAAAVADHPPRPLFDGPAPHSRASDRAPAQPPVAVLDPFHVYAAGEALLRDQLLALSEDQLRNVALAYHLLDPDDTAFATRTRPERVGEMVAAVRRLRSRR